jgi:uncharacterized protein YyaL (SSP411 family)
MNRLANSPSSYLQRAADEPIDWYPWSDEAFERARRENKPVLLSIGAVWCHWCHVMAHDTWHDPDTVKIINERFVAVKVDRDDRPGRPSLPGGDTALPLRWLAAHGLSHPGQAAFYGSAVPGKLNAACPFTDVLNATTTCTETVAASAALSIFVQRYVYLTPADSWTRYLPAVVSQMHDSFDPLYGGFGTSQKFPYSEALLFLLQRYESSGDKAAWGMVDFTLRQMANSGVYDHVGGGFHRYATDRAWRVPHFEKMLNDNALLLSIYLETFQMSGTSLFREIAEEIVTFVFRDLVREPAGFASSIDADVHGAEGAYYTWQEPELAELLGDGRVDYFMKAYNVTRGGNIGGANNVLYLSNEGDRQSFAEDREKLLAAREKREKPYVDMSIHTSWTALMITSFVRAYNVLGDRRCLDYARKSADFVISDMYRDGTLYRVYTDRPSVDGYLEDYACTIEALLELFNATQVVDYLGHAERLAGACDEKFFDRDHGGYFFVQAKDRNAMAQDKPITDFSVPGSNPQMAMNLIKLYYYTGNQAYLDSAQALVEGFFDMCRQYPLGHGTFFSAWTVSTGRTRSPSSRGERRAGDSRPDQQPADQEDHHARLWPVPCASGSF